MSLLSIYLCLAPPSVDLGRFTTNLHEISDKRRHRDIDFKHLVVLTRGVLIRVVS